LALVLKYEFSEAVDSSGTKKRKIDDKNQNIIEYALIKLPAVMFLKYLETYAPNFAEDCLR